MSTVPVAGTAPHHDLPPTGEDCDGCSAPRGAAVRITLHTGGQLLLCPACWHRHEHPLRQRAAAVRG